MRDIHNDDVVVLLGRELVQEKAAKWKTDKRISIVETKLSDLNQSVRNNFRLKQSESVWYFSRHYRLLSHAVAIKAFVIVFYFV